MADGVRLLVVGINPGLWTAATKTPFAHPGNRVSPALHRAGLIDDVPAFADGLDEAGRRPAVVAVADSTAYRHAFGRPRAVQGEQEEALGGARLWGAPNPSGLNAHDTIDSLAAAYRAPAVAAALL